MTVWVVETGCYENRAIAGIYATRELAITHHPAPADYPFPDTPGAFDISRRGGWRPDDPNDPDSAWDNGLDWDSAAHAYPMVVISDEG